MAPIDFGEDGNTGDPADVNGHRFGDWKVVTPPTTRTDGKSERTCSVCGKTKSKVVAHTILKVKTITISRSSATLLNGRSVQLWAKPAPADATTTAVSWKSSNTSVATVSPTGTITAKGKGTAVITCSARDGSGVKATCRITVTAPAPAPAPTKSTGDSGGSGDSGSGGGGSGGDYVWISATGSKYHKRNDCGTMNPNNASRVTTEEARNRGLEPCRKCFP